MMSPEQVYFAQQEYNRFEELMNTKELLTEEEYEFCLAYDKDIENDIHIACYGYLNLRVYSEQDHDEYQLEIEIGG